MYRGKLYKVHFLRVQSTDNRVQLPCGVIFRHMVVVLCYLYSNSYSTLISPSALKPRRKSVMAMRFLPANWIWRRWR